MKMKTGYRILEGSSTNSYFACQIDDDGVCACEAFVILIVGCLRREVQKYTPLDSEDYCR